VHFSYVYLLVSKIIVFQIQDITALTAAMYTVYVRVILVQMEPSVFLETHQKTTPVYALKVTLTITVLYRYFNTQDLFAYDL